MTNVTVNNQKIDQSPLESNKTFKDLMNYVITDIAKEKEVITNIKINNKDLSLEEEKTILLNPITNFEEINFTLQSSTELAFEALDSCSSFLELAISKINELSGLYQQNKIDSANSLFGEVIEIMDTFVQLMSKINSTLKKNSGKGFVKSETIKKLEIHLLSVLKALIPAKEKEDIIMLCDLLEYELIDNISQWKCQAIPELKKLKEN